MKRGLCFCFLATISTWNAYGSGEHPVPKSVAPAKEGRSKAPTALEEMDQAQDVLGVLLDRSKNDTLPNADFWPRVHRVLSNTSPCLLPLQRRIRSTLEALPKTLGDDYRSWAGPRALRAFRAAAEGTDIGALRRVVAAYPGVPDVLVDALVELARNSRHGARFAEAAIYLREAARLAPNRAGIWMNLAFVSKMLGNDAETKTALAKANDDEYAKKLAKVQSFPDLYGDDFEKSFNDAYAKNASGLSLAALLEPKEFNKQVERNNYKWLPSVSAGGSHSCALASGTPVCWGMKEKDKDATLPPTSLKHATAVSAGGRHSCALEKGVPVCWGDNSLGQTKVPPLTNATLLSAGNTHSCAVADGKLSCWGENGDKETEPPRDLGKVTAVSTGHYFTCAVANAQVQCWGLNSLKQASPLKYKNVTAVAAGESHACAIAGGEVQCWGDNSRGQKSVPDDLGKVTSISAGRSHTCAVTVEKTVRCWGDRRDARMVPPKGLKNVTSVSVGNDHACAFADGQPVCWGTDSFEKATVPPLPVRPFIADMDKCRGGWRGLVRE